jgi:hypothetical protein
MAQIANIGGRIAGITINPHGAVVEGIPLEHTYEEVMRQISMAERTCKFALGDLLVSASAHYGDKYARWAEVTGFEIQSLRDIASTCNRVPLERRRVEALSFSHHREVAALPAADQSKWLEAAEERDIGSARLRKSIQLGRVATATDMGRGKVAAAAAEKADPSDVGFENVHPFVNRLVTYLAKKEREGEYDDMSAEELYRFHLDLLPAINRWGKLMSRIRERKDVAVNTELDRDLQRLGLTSASFN